MSSPTPIIPTLIDPNAWAGRTYDPPLPLDLATFQGAIVAKLAQAFAGTPIGVFGFPEVPDDDWWTNQLAIAYLLVAYKRTEYSVPLSTSSMVQERRIEFDIKVIAREASWANFSESGVFKALLLVAKNALTGFRPPGCRNGFLMSEGFDEQDPEGRLWDYSLRFRIITIEIKQPQSAVEAALGLLKQVKFLERGGLTPIPAPAASYTFGLDGTIALPNENVSAVTVESLDGSTQYTVGTDYELAVASGVITAVEGGALGPNITVIIVYSYADIVTANEQGGPVPFYPSN